MLAAKRLEVSEALQRARALCQDPDPFWPLTRPEIEAAVPPEGISARKFLWACRDLFEARRRVLIHRPPLPPPPLLDLETVWERVFDEELERPRPKLDEGVYAGGLALLLEVSRPAGMRGKRSPMRDVDLLMVRESANGGWRSATPST
ncbi:MAG: hypothetical protein KatS3mg131_2521 [Candidatus Tectimicrobiota bacterium]|nr:MAG: hypothetical protein KatS3mg131_2521 [Candidatus Tectomicrobia bacterium]